MANSVYIKSPNSFRRCFISVFNRLLSDKKVETDLGPEQFIQVFNDNTVTLVFKAHKLEFPNPKTLYPTDPAAAREIENKIRVLNAKAERAKLKPKDPIPA